MSTRVLVTEARGFAPAAAERLRALATLELADLDRPSLLARAGDAHVLWVRLRHRIDAEVLDAAPSLRLVVTATTGLTHVDTDALRARRVELLSLRGETDFLRDVHATAEHTLALMLSLLRRLPAAVAHASRQPWDRDAFRGRELHGMVVGVLGLGRVGRQVARLLHAFGARVLAHDPAFTRDPVLGAADAEPVVAFVSLDELLARAELVTVHASAVAGAPALLGEAELRRMRPGAYLVNTARGELLDERALRDALEDGRLAGAALDVLAGEPEIDPATHPLLAFARASDRLLVTPHVGGCTLESMAKTECFLAERVARWLAPDAVAPVPPRATVQA